MTGRLRLRLLEHDELYRYHLFGVCFASDVILELPEALPGEQSRFALRAVTGQWPSASAGPVVQEDVDDWMSLRVFGDGSLEIEWKDWLAFWIDPLGLCVQYRQTGNKYPTAFEAYVANFAISACLLLQGEEFLHSTVIFYRDTGLGFLGQSGAGKSTITANFLSRGAELVTDDMLRITEHGEHFYAQPGQPRLKLFKETALMHLPAMATKGRWNPVSEKYLFDIYPPCERRPQRQLDALIFLAQPAAEEEQRISINRLEGLDLFQTLAASTMNSRMHSADRLARQFEFASRLSGKLAVYRLSYPRQHELLPDVIKVLEETVLTKCLVI